MANNFLSAAKIAILPVTLSRNYFAVNNMALPHAKQIILWQMICRRIFFLVIGDSV